MIIDLEFALTIAILWVIIAALLSPLEALGWWAGWYQNAADPHAIARPESPRPATTCKRPRRFVAYLTGISSASGEVHLPQDLALIERLGDRLADTILIDDIFPYSVTNRALTGQRIFAWFWRYALNRKRNGSPVGFLINMRNLFQVLVSADNRYGPIYNQGGAQLIMNALLKHGYPPDSGIPVTLLGYSGGGQICIGAAPYLKDLLNAPVTVISLGGVICSDPGLTSIEHLYHIQGARDWVQQIGAIVFPGRWRLMVNSSWNQSLEAGKITIIHLPGIKHTGSGGYLDQHPGLTGEPANFEKTIETLAGVLNQKA